MISEFGVDVQLDDIGRQRGAGDFGCSHPPQVDIQPRGDGDARADGKAFACVVERGFEMVSLPIKEMRLLPAGLRRGGPGRTVMAVRFAGENRMQYLLDLKAMAKGGSSI